MKIPKKKTKKKQETNVADVLGQEYASASEEATAAEARKSRANAEIKSFATTHGTDEGMNKVVTGKNFRIGFTKVPVYEADTALAKKLLKPEVWKACQETVFSVTKFNSLLEKGTISRVHAAKIIKLVSTTQRILVVKTKRNLQ